MDRRNHMSTNSHAQHIWALVEAIIIFTCVRKLFDGIWNQSPKNKNLIWNFFPISLRKLCENTGFPLLVFSRVTTESTILSLYRKIPGEKIRILAYFTQCFIGKNFLCINAMLWEISRKASWIRKLLLSMMFRRTQYRPGWKTRGSNSKHSKLF